jgi:hypothetical protein
MRDGAGFAGIIRHEGAKGTKEDTKKRDFRRTADYANYVDQSGKYGGATACAVCAGGTDGAMALMLWFFDGIRAIRE